MWTSASNQHHCLYTTWFKKFSLIIIISYSIQTLYVLKAQILPDYLARSQHVHWLCKARDSLVLKEHILSANSVCFSLMVFSNLQCAAWSAWYQYCSGSKILQTTSQLCTMPTLSIAWHTATHHRNEQRHHQTESMTWVSSTVLEEIIKQSWSWWHIPSNKLRQMPCQ